MTNLKKISLKLSRCANFDLSFRDAKPMEIAISTFDSNKISSAETNMPSLFTNPNTKSEIDWVHET